MDFSTELLKEFMFGKRCKHLYLQRISIEMHLAEFEENKHRI